MISICEGLGQVRRTLLLCLYTVMNWAMMLLVALSMQAWIVEVMIG
jgi:hypothetical protein